MLECYKLDEEHNIVPCSLMEWGKIYYTEEGQLRRRVGNDTINGHRVSTVFLGLDHSFGGEPMFFETMVFNEKDEDIYMKRYPSWKKAEEGHKQAIQWVKDGCKDE